MPSEIEQLSVLFGKKHQYLADDRYTQEVYFYLNRTGGILSLLHNDLFWFLQRKDDSHAVCHTKWF